MESIGIYEAKSRLSELVEKVEAGEPVTLTRRGKAVARIVAVSGKDEGIDRSTLMKEIRAFSKTVRLRGGRLSDRALRRLRDEGCD